MKLYLSVTPVTFGQLLSPRQGSAGRVVFDLGPGLGVRSVSRFRCCDLAAALESGRAIALAEAGTVSWYAFKISDTTYGIFDTFETDDAFQAHLSSQIPQASPRSDLTCWPPNPTSAPSRSSPSSNTAAGLGRTSHGLWAVGRSPASMTVRRLDNPETHDARAVKNRHRWRCTRSDLLRWLTDRQPASLDAFGVGTMTGWPLLNRSSTRFLRCERIRASIVPGVAHAQRTVVVERPIHEVFAFLADGMHDPKWRPEVITISCGGMRRSRRFIIGAPHTTSRVGCRRGPTGEWAIRSTHPAIAQLKLPHSRSRPCLPTWG